MNNLNKNWNNLFGEYTADETAWYGHWTSYSPDQVVISSKQAIRSFRSNSDNTVITHTNRYVDMNGNVIEEKTWQIDRETCNQPDGIIHPAMPWMRSLSFGAGATAWIAPKFIPGKPFGVELFFRDHNWRSSVVIMYGEDGQLNRIVHIREHLNGFSDESSSLESAELSGNWVGKKRSMTADLNISPEEEVQLSFNQSDHPRVVSLSAGMSLMFPESVTVDQPIQIAAGQRIANDQLKYLTAQYTAAGAFSLLTSANLQQL